MKRSPWHAPLVAACLAAPGVPGAADDAIGWYVVKPGDTLEKLSGRYLGSAQLWPMNQKLNPGLRNPHKLSPGQRIRIYLRPEPQAAEITKVANRVDEKPHPDPWTRAQVGDKLKENDSVRTFRSSSTELLFGDGGTLVLGEDSIIFLREMRASRQVLGRNAIEVQDGQADLIARPRRGRSPDIEIVIGESGKDAVTARPKPSVTSGSETRVRREKKGDAKLMVYSGESALETAVGKVRVPQGMGSSATPGKAPKPPEKLLSAPTASVAGPGPIATPTFGWNAVAGAASYTALLCSDASCASLVRRQAELGGSEWRPDGPLPPGRYFFRVSGVSASGLDGYASAPVAYHQPTVLAGSVVEAVTPSSVAGRPGVTLRLYKDGGDGLPDGRDDVLERTVNTDAEGRFAIGAGTMGTYWLTVDSRDVRSAGALRSTDVNPWAEQTLGPKGSLCADGNGGTRELGEAGPCPGGRRGDRSDDASGLASSEHVAKIVTGGVHVENLSFTFSFGVVTSLIDDSSRPGGGQGSLRQVLTNATAMNGARAVPELRFSPAMPFAPVALKRPLPTLDGALRLDGASVSGPLTIDAGGLDVGLDVAAPVTLRNVSIRNAGTGLLVRSSVDATDLHVSGSGTGIRVVGNGSTFRQVNVSGNKVGIEILGTMERPANDNAIEGSTFEANGIGVALVGNSDRNRVRTCAFHQGAIRLSTVSRDVTPIQNELTGNTFTDGTGSPIEIALHSANEGVRPPIMESACLESGYLEIRGNAPDRRIEVYRVAGASHLPLAEGTPAGDFSLRLSTPTLLTGEKVSALVVDAKGNTSALSEPVVPGTCRNR